MAGCECGSPQGYIIDAGLIGDGDPIVNDGGPVDTRDAGPVVCDDDTLEDNDTRTDAVVLQSGTAASAVFCGGDDDWFSLNVAVGCSIAVALRFGASPDAGDLDVLLFAPDGALAGSAQTTGPQENLNVVATRAGAYAARVRGGDRDALDYTITLTNTCSSDLSCPADDIYENNDTAIDATAIDTAVSVDAIACPSDVDVFGVPVTVGCIADSVVTFVDVDGDIDLELLRADGTVLGSSRGVTDQERIVKVVSEVNMTQRVSLFGNDPSGNSYRIRTREVCDSALSCPSDDPFEPNDDSGAATRLESGGDGALGVLCGVNEDLYATHGRHLAFAPQEVDHEQGKRSQFVCRGFLNPDHDVGKGAGLAQVHAGLTTSPSGAHSGPRLANQARQHRDRLVGVARGVRVGHAGQFGQNPVSGRRSFATLVVRHLPKTSTW